MNGPLPATKLGSAITWSADDRRDVGRSGRRTQRVCTPATSSTSRPPMNRAVGTGSPRASTLASMSACSSSRVERQARRHGDDPGAGREHGERRRARHEMRQEGSVAVVDAGEHARSPRRRPVAAATSGRIGPSVSQACRSGGNSARPSRGGARGRKTGPPPAATDGCGRPARSPRWPSPPTAAMPSTAAAAGCRWPARSAAGKALLLPVELRAQAQAEGSTGEPVAANGSSSGAERRRGRVGPGMLVVQRRQRQLRRRPSARPPPRAPPARCSRSAPGAQARASAVSAQAHSRRDRAAGRAVPAGPRRAASVAPADLPASSSRMTLALVLPMSRTAMAMGAGSSTKWRRAGRLDPPRPCSEVELVDVVLVEDERRAEQDLAAVDDLQLAELAGLDRRCRPASACRRPRRAARRSRHSRDRPGSTAPPT